MSEMLTCSFCKTEIDWDCGNDRKGTIWGCDNCNTYFCESCFKERHGAEALYGMVKAESEGDILCPDCYKKDGDKDAEH